MSWISEIYSLLRELILIGKTKHRRARHLFVQRAIAINEYPDHLHYTYRTVDDLATRIFQAQMTEAGRGNLARAAMGTLARAEERAIRKRLKRQRQIGLPDVFDQTNYVENVDRILQDMVEDRILNFVAPNRYGFRRVE